MFYSYSGIKYSSEVNDLYLSVLIQAKKLLKNMFTMLALIKHFLKVKQCHVCSHGYRNINGIKVCTVLHNFTKHHSHDFICSGTPIQYNRNGAPWNLAMQNPWRLALGEQEGAGRSAVGPSGSVMLIKSHAQKDLILSFSHFCISPISFVEKEFQNRHTQREMLTESEKICIGVRR